jgi:FKBP-type peptidyl-prolyl cis-trans isomerase
MMRIHRFLMLALPLALAACLGSATEPTLAAVETTTFAPALGVNLATSTRTPSGLYYRDSIPGTGVTLVKGQTVGVFYDAYYSNGQRFTHWLASDSTPPTPLSFVLGNGVLIPGFEEGVTGMKVGGIRQLIIPPYLAFGYAQNDVLVFNIEAKSAQ